MKKTMSILKNWGIALFAINLAIGIMIYCADVMSTDQTTLGTNVSVKYYVPIIGHILSNEFLMDFRPKFNWNLLGTLPAGYPNVI